VIIASGFAHRLWYQSGFEGLPKVGGDHYQMITVSQREYRQRARLAGPRTSRGQHDDWKAGNPRRQSGMPAREPGYIAVDPDYYSRA
jgi:hypothetical protein